MTIASFASMLLLGLALGMRHATDADHVVAVTTIVARERRIWASTAIGALWGLGHTATILVVGCAIILFHVVIPARVGLALELSVAMMLIALGVANLTGLVRRAHADLHDLERPRGGRFGLTRAGIVRPVAVGLVHGLAGSAAVALLVVATNPNGTWAAAYLLVFGLGTVVGMMTLTTILSAPIAYAFERIARVNVWLVRATGVGSVAFGLFLAYQLVAVHGMFTSAPSWTPQ